MSAGRGFRRLLSGRSHPNGRTRSGTEPQLLETIGSLEVWLVGGVMHVLPALRDDMPSELKNALDRRRRASLEGRCDCGAETVVHGDLRPGAVVRGSMEHEADCTASDVAISELIEQHGGAS